MVVKSRGVAAARPVETATVTSDKGGLTDRHEGPPEFLHQLNAASIFTTLLAASHLLTRRQTATAWQSEVEQ